MSCKNCYCSIEFEMYLDWCLGLSVNSVLFVNEPNLRAADLGRVVTCNMSLHWTSHELEEMILSDNLNVQLSI